MLGDGEPLGELGPLHCAGTITVEADANVVRDIDGDILFSFDTNGSPACSTCRNRRQFNGTRPPTE